MRRWVAVLAVATLVGSLTTACRFSKVKSDATVHVSGRALNAAGQPLANTTLRLFKEADIGEAIFGTILAVGTLGSICLVQDPPTVCTRAKSAKTDDNGNYRFTLKGRDTQGTAGTESTLDVVVADPAAGVNGPNTTLRFTVRENEVTLPDARLWATKLGAARQPRGMVGATWSPLPSSAGSSAFYAVQVFDTQRQASMWTQPASRDSGFVDERILEDKTATVAASATTKLSGSTGTGSMRASYLSTRVPLQGNAGAPPSRGRPCSAISGTAPDFTATAQQPCAATDGNLLDPAHLPNSAAGVATGVVVDLGTPRPVNLVVARGVSGVFVVEVSGDGRSFRQVAMSDGKGLTSALAPAGAPSARYVRVRSQTGLDESLLLELSIW